MTEHYWEELGRALERGLIRQGREGTAEALYEVLNGAPAPSGDRDLLADPGRTLKGKASKDPIKLAQLAQALSLPIGELLQLRELGLARRRLDQAEPDDEIRPLLEWLVATLEGETMEMESQRPAIDPGYVTLGDWGTPQLDARLVIVGDRRNDPPCSVADILAYGASPRDLEIVPWLGLSREAKILVDRLLLLAPDDQRQRLMGHDTLALASGKVNILTMLCQGRATFEPIMGDAVGEDVADWIELLRHEFDPEVLRHHRDSDEKPESDRLQFEYSLRALRRQFGARDFWDVLAPEFARRQRLHQYQHLGTIALARHPWAPEKVVVLIHGTSLEATYAGIHAFTESFDECARRPLGGVYYVQASGDRPPYMWTSGVKARWLTPPYTVAEYRERLAVSPLPHAHEVEALLELLAARAKANTHPSDEDSSGATEATEG